MVVHVIYTRREQGGRGKSLVRLAGSTAAVAATASGGGRSLSRATSPPPHATVAACWESRSLRCGGGEENWQEVVAAGPGAAAPDFGEEVTDEYKLALGAPPTDDEVRAAIASIKQVFEEPSAVDSDTADLQALALPIRGHLLSGILVNHFALDADASEIELEEWIGPAMLVNSSALLTREHQNVVDAFYLLQEDSSVQKMVMALSTDKTVWDAVMKNEVVQEFKRSFQDAKETDLKRSSTGPGAVKWVLQNTQAKIKELVEQILRIVNTLFQAEDKNYDLYDDAVKMSFMLSVFVFIVVAIARMR